MKEWIKDIFLFALLAVVIGVIARPNRIASQSNIYTGLQTVDGEPVDSIYPEGTDIAYIVYFKLNCQYCEKVMRAMEQVNIPVVAVGITTDNESVRELVNELGITYTVLTHFKWADLPEKVAGTPHTQLVGLVEGEWTVLFEFSGGTNLSEEELGPALNQLVQEMLNEN